MGLIDNIRMFSTNKHSEDESAPAKLEVTRAEFGQLFRATRDRSTSPPTDPLLIELRNVEPGCKLQILVANDPRKTFANSAGDIKEIQIEMKDLGKSQQLALSDKKAAELGIRPGDCIELRQVDKAGNASAPTRVYLNGDGTTLESFLAAEGAPIGDMTLTTSSYEYRIADGYYGTVAARSDKYNFVRARDTAKPVVHPEAFSLELMEPKSGKALLSGKLAVERLATVVVTNLASRQTFSLKSDEDGSFDIPVTANAGDPLQIRVFDRAMVAEDLGTITFQPQVEVESSDATDQDKKGHG